MADLMTAPGDFRHEVGPPRGALTDDEEGGTRSMLIQQVEYTRRINLVGTVINRQPDCRVVRHKAREDADEALGGRDEERVENEEVRRKKEYDRRLAPTGQPKRRGHELGNERVEEERAEHRRQRQDFKMRIENEEGGLGLPDISPRNVFMTGEHRG
jgi:hypothetical protein